MYIFPEMINMGLNEGQQWPSETHKNVARNLLLCNRLVFTRDLLTDGVQWILSKPVEFWETATLDDVLHDTTRPFEIPV